MCGLQVEGTPTAWNWAGSKPGGHRLPSWLPSGCYMKYCHSLGLDRYRDTLRAMADVSWMFHCRLVLSSSQPPATPANTHGSQRNAGPTPYEHPLMSPPDWIPVRLKCLPSSKTRGPCRHNLYPCVPNPSSKGKLFIFLRVLFQSKIITGLLANHI